MEDFERDIRLELEDTSRKIENAVINTAVYGWSLVTAVTPVHTGLARAGWNISPNDPDDSANEATPNPPSPNFSFSIERDNRLVLSNPVEYIGYLEEGAGNRRSFGMLKKSLPKIEGKFQRELSKI